jgi:hypothetical protein
MRPPIQRLTVQEFAALVQRAAGGLTRKIDAVHLHHTWRPRRSEFRGLATIEAMRRYHVGLKWSDIAQHLTIDPQGVLWTGRNWNAPPASQAGRNGTRDRGPFMIEMIGDFDAGADTLEPPQLDAVIDAVSRLLFTFDLDADALHFHRELGSPKTCPGSGVDKAALLQRVEAALARLVAPPGRSAQRGSRPRPGPAPFDSGRLLGAAVLLPFADAVEDRSVPESELAADGVEELARSLSAPRAPAQFGVITREEDEWADLRPHVINLTRGRLSQTGLFRMKPGALDAIVDAIADYAVAQAEPRLMLHAHGGLVDERSALGYARLAHRWWLDQGIYPVYFVWETGAFDVLRQKLGIRGFGDVRDRLFEEFARKAGGKWAWGEMKESARLASSPDTGDGHPGGAYLFAQQLAGAMGPLPEGATLAINAVGHSAGAIFHAHLLPLFTARSIGIDSLSLLAPAIRNDLFAEKLLPEVSEGRIRRLLMCTMNEQAERDDDLIEVLGGTVYGKSLLYLISRAFEAKRKTPLLGLEETLRDDQTLWTLFNGGGGRLELATAKGEPPNPNTRSRRHGCFDNDPATMKTVATVVRDGEAPAQPFPADESCEAAEERRRQLALDPGAVPFGSPGGGPLGFGRTGAAPAGRRVALCVGIDAYPTSPLAGCVRDAEAWTGELRRQGFSVTTLVDRQATRQGIIESLSSMVAAAAPGDVLVLQYSGHGTQVADLDGDETDRYDEAFVPVDYQSGALLLDDDLAGIYARLPRGALLTLFMDCCHSGTNSRFRPVDTRAARAGLNRRFLPMTPALEEAHRTFRGVSRGRRDPAAEASLEGVVHFAACQDNQYAYEMDGAGNFTRVAVPALLTAIPGRETNESFLARVAQQVQAFGHPQTPKLMRLPAALAGRPVLEPPGAAGVGQGMDVMGAAAGGELLYHLQAALRLAQERG